MEVLALLDTLEDMIENCRAVPFTEKVLVDRQEIMDILNDIKIKLPDDVKQAKWVKEERQRILLEAQKEANDIVKEAETRIISMIDEHEITRKAYEQKNEIIEGARKTAKEIVMGSKDYANEILSKVETILGEAVQRIRVDKDELK